VNLDQDNEELSDEISPEDDNPDELLIERSEASDNSNSNEDPDCTDELIRDLADWAVTFIGLPKNRLTQLLKIMRKNKFLEHFPKDCRTLLQSMRKVTTKEVHPGRYFHFGLLNGVMKSIRDLNGRKNISKIKIYVNWDGIPMAKSSGTCFWPLLGKLVDFLESDPFVIGLYCGRSQPHSTNQYFEDFREEALSMEEHGCKIDDVSVQFEITAYIMDAPARSKILGTVSHTGYNCCTRCVCKGLWIKMPGEKKGRVTFPDTNADPRTDKDYREHLHPEHHGVKTFIEDLSGNIVRKVPPEGLHLLDLGATKRFLLFLLKYKGNARMKKQDREMMSNHVAFLGGFLTSDFARKTRGLDEMPRWKATEYKNFRDYLSIIVLKDRVSEDIYNLFMHYHVAVKLLSNSEFYSMPGIIDYAKHLLEVFVRNSIILLGPHFVSYNIHSLIHLPDDVREFGPIYEWAGYWAENQLQKIKYMIIAKARMLEQAVKRIDEHDRLSVKKKTKKVPILRKEHFSGQLPPLVSGRQFRKLTHGRLKLSIAKPDNIVFLSQYCVLKIENILLTDDNNIKLIGKQYTDPINFFNVPIESQDLWTHEVSTLSQNCSVHSLYDVKWKGLKLPTTLPTSNSYIVLPVHTSMPSDL